MTEHLDYLTFLQQKIRLASFAGFDVDDEEINTILKPHQRACVKWAVKGGNRALFERFGLGKTVQQIEIIRLVQSRAGGKALIVCPLGVRQEFKRDGTMLGVHFEFIRRPEEMVDGQDFYLTNYESIRDGKLDPNLFTVVSLDEASVLRSYGSKTYQEFLPLFDRVRFKFVATATPSPNRYKELIHYAGFLGIMDTGQALTRFFQRDSTQANNLTLYPHKTQEFWMWLNSWAIFLQKPSDLCRCSCHVDQTSKDSGSASLSSNAGSLTRSATALGSAGATAATPTSQHQTTSRPDASSVADACGQSTVEREVVPMASGRECSPDAPAKAIETGRTTAAEESPSASAGENSPISSPTWESRHQPEQSSGATTAATTSPGTATGQVEPCRRETPAELSSSPTTAELNPSQHGPKSSTSATGSSTADTSSAGRPNGSSKAYCDSCRCDEGYDLPPLKIVYHEVLTDLANAGTEKDGQGLLFKDAALGLQAAAAEKRDSLPARIAKMQEILADDPDSHYLIWHHLEAERHAVCKALPEAVAVYGTQDLDDREQAIVDFSDGKFQYLAAKPEIAGSGCNFQRHCHKAIFLGIDYSFNDVIQAIHRIYRFLQTREVEIHIIHSEAEREILRSLQAKWVQHEDMVESMTNIIKEHGLNHLSMADVLARTIGVERLEVKSERFTVANNDCVIEARRQPENSKGLIVTSIPFANHYEYTPSYNDFGHTENNDHFWAQMDFLTPELLRILQPGRLYCCHVKDRILFGNVTGAGAPTVSPFHCEAIMHARKHGFDYMGMITIVTDVVRENNQTYRLGWSEQCKDGTKMGVGSPEYVLLFRKPQTDRSRGYADLPVSKSKDDYTRARWQVDAHAFWRSSGNRQLTPDELASLGPDKLAKAFTAFSLQDIYDYEFHVRIGEELEARGALPSTFMSLAPGSHDPAVWHDVNRMITLNGNQSQKGLQNHVCPLQFDIVDRLIDRYSNKGEVVYDPFGGLMTVPYRAILKGRIGEASELNTGYFFDGVQYLKSAEREFNMPGLFDFDSDDKKAA